MMVTACLFPLHVLLPSSFKTAFGHSSAGAIFRHSRVEPRFRTLPALLGCFCPESRNKVGTKQDNMFRFRDSCNILCSFKGNGPEHVNRSRFGSSSR
jgi:hypothetical protein